MAKRSQNSKVAIRVTKRILHVLLNAIFYLVVALIVMKGCKIAYDFSYQLFGNVTVTENAGTPREITITDGESTMQVASKLQLNKLIVDKNSFYVKAKIQGLVIQPGRYTLDSSMNYDKIFEIISGAAETEE